MYTIKMPDNIDERILNAIKHFWLTRSGQFAKQTIGSKKDHGNRGAVTGGKQLDGFIELIYDILVINGIPKNSIFINTHLELPGFYRPSKKWDLLVVDNNELIIAIEFKSQVGPSFGNNFNNRTEEAMGTALDLWTAYREGILGITSAPWLGYFIILEDCIKSNEPIKIRSPHFPVSNEFINTSYKERYEIFCKKLLLERQYSSACFVTTSYTQSGYIYDFPQKSLSFEVFASSMISAAIAHFSKRGIIS